jgi:hypothetical protein
VNDSEAGLNERAGRQAQSQVRMQTMRFVLPAGIFGPSGEPLTNGKDMEAVAAGIESRLWDAVQAKREGLLRTALVVALLCVAAGVVLAIAVGSPMPVLILVAGAAIAGILYLQAKRLVPDEQVESVYKLHWPLLALPDGDRSMLHDLSGILSSREVGVSTLRNPTVLTAARAALKRKLSELSVLEPYTEKVQIDGTTLFGIDAVLCQRLDELARALDDTERARVHVSALPRVDPIGSTIRDWKRWMVDVQAPPRIGDLSPSEVRVVHAALGGVRALSTEAQYDLQEVLDDLDLVIEASIRPIELAHAGSMTLIHSQSLLASRTEAAATLLPYCPKCNVDPSGRLREPLLESSLLEYTAESETWRCPVCRGDFGGQVAAAGDADPVAEIIRFPFLSRSEDVADQTPRDRSRLQPDDPILFEPFKQELFGPILAKFRDSYRTEILAVERDIDNQLERIVHERDVKIQERKMDLGKEKRKRELEIMQHDSNARTLKAQIEGLGAALLAYQSVSAQHLHQYRSECQALAQQAAAEAARLKAMYQRDFETRLRQAHSTEQSMMQQQKIEDDARTVQVTDAIDRLTAVEMMTESQKEKMQSFWMKP